MLKKLARRLLEAKMRRFERMAERIPRNSEGYPILSKEQAVRFTRQFSHIHSLYCHLGGSDHVARLSFDAVEPEGRQ